MNFKNSFLALTLIIATATAPDFSFGTERVMLDSFENLANESYHLAKIKLKSLPESAVTRHEHIILMDTSASQLGSHRDQSLSVLTQMLKTLPASESVWIWAVDVKAQPLHLGFAKPGSQDLEQALSKLSRRVPAGVTNISLAIDSVLSAVRTDNFSIMYIGDGMSSAYTYSPEEMQAVINSLTKRKAVFSAYAVGSRRDIELLGILAVRTGGIILEDSASLDASKVATHLADSVMQPIWYTSKFELKGNDALAAEIARGSIQMIPDQAVPVRADRSTCILFKGLNVTQTFPEGANLKFVISSNETVESVDLQVNQPDNQYAYIAALWKRAVDTKQVAYALAGDNACLAAFNSFDQAVDQMISMGNQSLKLNKPNEAREIAEFVRMVDPANVEAKLIMNVSNRIESKTVALTQPSGDPLLDSRTDAPKPAESNPISKLKAIQQAAAEKLQLEVSRTIEETRKKSITDPDVAIDIMKQLKSIVNNAPDIDPDIRQQLTNKVSSTIQEFSSKKTRIELEQIKNQERLAEVEARARITENINLEEDRLRQLIDQVRSLVEIARHGDDSTYARAEGVAKEAVNLKPGNAPANAARFYTEAVGQLNDAFRLRALRADRFLETLTQVELSHVPFPDEPPVRYPNAQVWKALSERREKWKSVDLHYESKNAERIRKALEKETEFEFVDTPLKNVIDNISDIHNITILIDDAALEDEGVSLDDPVNLILSGITLKSSLKILLEKYNLTWIIKDDVMKITSIKVADSEENFETRVYPVGDLVVQLTPGGGGIGGIGGGVNGGGGIGGGGGINGGIGGGGGGNGIFNIPAQPLKKN